MLRQVHCACATCGSGPLPQLVLRGFARQFLITGCLGWREQHCPSTMRKDELDSLKAYCEAWLIKAEANKASTSLSAFLSEHPLSTFATCELPTSGLTCSVCRRSKC